MHLRHDWKPAAACRGMNTERFFPLAETDPQAPEIRQARAPCQACPVTRECLTEALACRDVHGIRAGLTGGQRAALLRSNHTVTTSDPTAGDTVRHSSEDSGPAEHQRVSWNAMSGPAESIGGHRPDGRTPNAWRAGQHITPAPQRRVAYHCSTGHETVLALAAEAEAPETWTCRACGQPAGTDPQNPPDPAEPTTTQGNPLRTHRAPIDFVRERRSEAELQTLLDETLAKLHT
jgi:hypothetical protein